jgi:hypothetical protein
MASKTVWIAGGIVVAIGVVAYVAFKPGPANTDAAGTIVEAKRARADGTNSFNPSPTASTTDQKAADASKGTAGADAAKDAATAAGAGDNLRRAEMDAKVKAAQSADAAVAASGSGNVMQHAKSTDDARASYDAASAVRGGPATNARSLASQSTMQKSTQDARSNPETSQK